MSSDDAILTLLQEVHAENRRLQRAALVLLALLAITLLPGWIFQDPEPNLIPVQQALKTGRLELTNAQGKVVAVLQAVDGKNEVVVACHPNGLKAFEAQSKDGYWHGTYNSWDTSGLKTCQGVYLDGRPHGQWVFYAQKTEGGKSIKAPVPVRRGNYEKGVQVGKWDTWYASGQKESEGSYDDKGNATGDWQYWNKDGAVDPKKTGRYQDGKRVD